MAIQFVFWHWWALGVLLLIVELVAPGMFFLWMAESAFVVGLIIWLFPSLGWETQIILFSVLSIVSIAAFRHYLGKHPIPSDRPLLNQRAAQYIGRVFTLDQPIVNGRGKIRVDDSIWKVRGEDCGPGTRVRVTAADGVILEVARVDEAAPVPRSAGSGHETASGAEGGF